MSATVSLRPMYQSYGWVVQEIRLDGWVLWVEMRRDKRMKITCPECAEVMKDHRKTLQSARDLPFGPIENVFINYEAVQGRCPGCGLFVTLRPLDIQAGGRATWRFMEYVSRLCRHMACDSAASLLPISTSTARRWDKRVLLETLEAPDLDDLRVILVDEKSIGKGHNYLTVVMNGENGEVLHIEEGKKKESLETFFQKLTPEQLANIEVVGVDRSGAYKAVVEDFLGEGVIVFDKFHIIANFNDVLDKVRREAWRNARGDEKALVKGQRYALLKNRENLKAKEKRSLRKLLKANKALGCVYVLKDALKLLWTYTYKAWASKYLDRWIAWAEESGIPEVKRFARGLERDWDCILRYVDTQVTTSRLEAFNNTIGRIIHRACGYQDLEYLELKIRQAA